MKLTPLPFIFFLLLFAPGLQASSLDSLAKQIRKNQSDTNTIKACLQLVEEIYNSDPDSAMKVSERGMEVSRQLDDTISIIGFLGWQSYLFKQKGQIEQALALLKKAIRLQENGDDMESLASAYSNAAGIYLELGHFENAIRFYEKGMKIREDIKDLEGMSNSYYNLGNTYSKSGDYVTGLAYFKKSRQILTEIGFLPGLAYVNMGLATNFMHIGEADSAMIYYLRGLEIFRQTGDKRGEAYTLNGLGKISFERNDVGAAEKYGQESLKAGRELGYPAIIRDASKLLYEVYSRKGNFAKALKMYETHVYMRDSILKEENHQAAIRQELEYEFDKKTQADSIRAVEAEKIADEKIARKNAELEKEQTRRYALYGGLALLGLFGAVMYNRLGVTRKQKHLIEKQKLEVEVKNKEITDSINYARRLQEAILPSRELISASLRDSFIFYRPKDIVAGDFYWFEKQNGMIYLAAADCTGHGVPGAMVSVVCSNALTKALLEENINEPGRILDRAAELVSARFGGGAADGMDISLIAFNPENGEAQWAGANNPIWIIRQNKSEIEEIKADKQPVGKHDFIRPFTTHRLQLNPGDRFYLFSDGYSDQFGGPNGKKFKSANLKKLLLSLEGLTMKEQNSKLQTAFDDWRGSLEQVDDVCLMGVMPG